MSLGRAVLWFGAAYGVAIGGYLALNAAAGRMLGPEAFGYFVAALTLTTALGQVGLVGVHRSGLREASRLQREDVDQLATLRRGVRAVALISLPLTGVISSAVTWVLLSDLPALDRWAMTLAVGALVVLSGLQKLWANYLRGFGQVRFASMLEGRSGGAFVAVLQAVLVVLVWQFAPAWGLPGALCAVAVGYAIPVFMASRAVARYWGHVPSGSRLFRDLREVAARDWKFASVQVATLLNASAEIWIAGLLLSSVDTSMFSAAQRMSMLVVLPMTAMQVVFSPAISRLVVKHESDDLEPLLRTGATLASGATAVICLPLLIAPAFVLTVVFGPGFDDAVIPLQLLTTAMFVNALMGLAGLTLSMAHREGTAASIQWWALGVRVVVGSLAAAVWGLDALAVSAAAVSALMFVTMWGRTRRDLGVNTAVTARPSLALIRQTGG